MSNNSTDVANLATLGFNPQALVSDVNFQTTTGTALATDHFVFDGDLRPASSTAMWQSGSGATGTVFSTSRTYDPVGNVTSVSTTHAAVPGQTGSGGSETQNFCYDEQNRLVWAGNSGTQPAAGNGTCGSGTLASGLSGASYSSSVAYTHLGQLWQGPLNGSGAAQQYLYCDSTHPHQLKGLYPAGTTCTNPTGATYSALYDNWGNVTSRTSGGTAATLAYDVLDHLVTWNAGSSNQAWYAYDASGNRVLSRSTTGSGTSITTYAFGLEEHLYSATGSNTGNTYYYSLGGRLIGALTGTTPATQFFLTDALGSVLATFSATAGSAAVLGNQVYGPYGNQRYNKGPMGTAKGYTGQYADATGLDYYNARYYDPVVGLFISADTVQDNLHGFDPYAYVGGNPETRNDPTGHFGWIPAMLGGALIGAVLGTVGFVAGTLIQDAINGRAPTWGQVGDQALRGGIFGALTGSLALPILFASSTLPACVSDPAVCWGAGIALGSAIEGISNGIADRVEQFGGHIGNQIHQAIFNPPPVYAPGPTNPIITFPAHHNGSGQIISFPAHQNGPSSSPIFGYPRNNSTSYTALTGSQSPGGYYTVGSGDSLWAIASRFYGSGFQWQRIYGANRGVIGGNPNLIFPGERLVIPR